MFFSHNQLIQYYSNLFFFKPSNNEDEPFRKQLFITKWIRDENMRQCEGVVTDPTSPPGLDKNFNMWLGYNAAKLSPVNEDIVDELIQPIVQHLHDVITCGNQQHTEWLLDYMASMIQRPQYPTRVAISLYGLQGVGKGIVFDWFRTSVMGEHCSFQTARP